jgi:type I site-specific restriction endonuclease
MGALVPQQEGAAVAVVYSDFEDQIGVGTEIDLAVVATAGDVERFRRKVRAFLAEHKGEMVINKIHHNWPIAPDDIVEPERLLIDSGVASSDDTPAGHRRRKRAVSSCLTKQKAGLRGFLAGDGCANTSHRLRAGTQPGPCGAR